MKSFKSFVRQRDLMNYNKISNFCEQLQSKKPDAFLKKVIKANVCCSLVL